jgi:peptide/nickel transport system permease protein
MSVVSRSRHALRPILGDTLARVRGLPPTMIVGGLILAVHVIVAVTGPAWTPYPMSKIGTGMPFSPHSAEHWFGTDGLGRDVFSRVICGAHVVLLLALAGTLVGTVSGALIGLTCAYVAGWFDELMMRLADALVSIPFLMLALLVITAAGPERAGNPILLIVVVGVLYAPRMARMARATALELVTRDFVAIARLRGESTWSIIVGEVLPNATGTLLVEFAVRLGNAPLVIGSLGFLGFGIRPPTPEWGLMISENRNALMTAPITVIGPAVVLASFVIGANLFTDGLARVFGQTARPAAR